MITNDGFPRLEELTIHHVGTFDQIILGPIPTLKKLTFLKCLPFDIAWRVIKVMPALRELNIEQFMASLKFERELVKYLQEERRELCFNGIMYNRQA